MNIKKSVAKWMPVKLVSSDDFNTDMNNIAWNNAGLSVWYIKEGGDWIQKTLTANDWDICTDLVANSGRIYKVLFSASELDTLGGFNYTVYLTGAVTYDGYFEIVNNTNDDIADLVNALNDFDPDTDKVLLNDVTQGQIDDIETKLDGISTDNITPIGE